MTEPPPDPAAPPVDAALEMARAVARAVATAGGRAWLAGGCVRDRLRGVTPADYDLEVFGVEVEPLARLLAAFGSVDVVGRAFGVFKVTRAGVTLDVGLPRTESKAGTGHRGFAIEADPHLDLKTATARRDLTINAILEDPLTGEIADPFGGRGDLARGVLRHVSDAFADDPLRVLRVVQFAARFEFAIAPETAAFCRTIDLSTLPRERVADEVAKWLAVGARPSLGLAAVVATGADALFPELRLARPEPSERDRAVGRRLDAAARARDGLADPTAFMLAALLAPLPSEPDDAERVALAAAFLEKAALGTARQALALSLVCEAGAARALAAAPEDAAAPALRRLALRAPLEPLARLVAADGEATGTGGGAGRELRRRAAALGVLDAPPRPLLHGRDLLALGASPGKRLGELLDRLFEMQLDGKLRDAAAARAAAVELLKAESGP